jgi:hypothetical protein
MTVGGNVNIPNGGAMRSTGAFCIIAAGGGGFVTIRPKGSADSSVALNINATGGADFTGVISAADFTYTSDVRLKKNIKNVELRDLSSVPLVTWDWRQKGKGSGRGVLAQTLQKLAPELVTADEKGQLTVDKLNMVLERVAYLEQKLKKAGLW